MFNRSKNFNKIGSYETGLSTQTAEFFSNLTTFRGHR